MSHVRFDLDETQASSTPSLTSLTRLSAFGGGARRMTFDAKRNPVGGAGTRKRPPLVPVDQNSTLQDSPLKRHAVCNEDSFKDDAFSNDFRQQLLHPQVGRAFPPPQTSNLKRARGAWPPLAHATCNRGALRASRAGGHRRGEQLRSSAHDRLLSQFRA